MESTPKSVSSTGSCAGPACGGLSPAEERTPLEEGATCPLTRHTVESLEGALEEKMQKAGTTEEARMSFENVPSGVIDEFCRGRTNARLKDFDPTNSKISLRMTSTRHEAASHLGAGMVRKALARAGMGRSMDFFGSARAPEVAFRTRGGKAPDAYFQLKPQYRMGHKHLEMFPQVVIETAVSERGSELYSDVAHWFKIAESAVRLVMTISMRRLYVTIAVWILGPRAGTFKRMGQIVAKRIGKKLELTATTTTTPITVPFSAVFIREAQGAESDLVFAPEDFVELKSALERSIAQGERRAKKPEEVPPATAPYNSQVVEEKDVIISDDIKQPKRRRDEKGRTRLPLKRQKRRS